MKSFLDQMIEIVFTTRHAESIESLIYELKNIPKQLHLWAWMFLILFSNYVISWFSQEQNQFLLGRQAFVWSLSRLLLVWGKCFPNIIITKMVYGKMCVSQFWTPIFIDGNIYQCGKDVILPLYIIWNNLYNPIELLADVKTTLWLML